MKITLSELRKIIRKIIKENVTPVITVPTGTVYVGVELDNESHNMLVELLENKLLEIDLPFENNIDVIAHHISIVPPPRMGLVTRRNQINSGAALSTKDQQKYDKDKLDVDINDKYIDNIISGIDSQTKKYFTVTHIGYNDKAIAVKVESQNNEFKTLFKFLHVTLAIPVNGKAADSNSITQWEEVKNFNISGILKIL